MTFHFTTSPLSWIRFFFNDTATTEIYTLSLHDALPISVSFSPVGSSTRSLSSTSYGLPAAWERAAGKPDRKSTRLNSSHVEISYAVFCLKKKKDKITYFYAIS